MAYFSNWKDWDWGFQPLLTGDQDWEKAQLANEWRDDRIWTVNRPGFYKLGMDHNQNDVAIICIPGGAYFKLNPINNGFNYGHWMRGDMPLIADPYVLIHTLPLEGDRREAPFADLQLLIKYLKTSLKYKYVGVWGVSAGGHLAALSDIADFKILFSPVVSMHRELEHENSRRNLLGDEPARSVRDWFSADIRIDIMPKPTFILQARNDKKVNYLNAMNYYRYQASRDAKSELHIFPDGDHEICLELGKWENLLYTWIKKVI